MAHEPPTLERAQLAFEDEEGHGAHVDLAGRASPGADTAAEQRELRAFLAQRLRALPLDLRVPVVLRDVESWSNQEVADLLGLSLAATKSRIHRGRMRIRKELDAWRRAESLPQQPAGVADDEPLLGSAG